MIINDRRKTIDVVELFAGVGGFRLGLERASKSFKTVYANQWEPNKNKQHAYDCYVSHYGENSSYTNVDISLIKGDIPSHDLLVGGFPCQDYSVAHGNSAKGIEGKKGVLWWDIKDIISTKKPTMVLLENVDRLIRSPYKQKGRDFGIILRSLFDEGYNVEWRVINAADYGHVQRRRRVFIFAFKNEITTNMFSFIEEHDFLLSNGFFSDIFPIEYSNKSNKPNKIIDLSKYIDLVDLSDNLNTQFYNSGVMINGKVFTADMRAISTEEKKTLGDILQKEAMESKFFIGDSINKFRKLKGSKKIPRFKPNGESYFYSEGSLIIPDPSNKPARTILTSESNVSRTTHVVVDPLTGFNRLLTPIECERLNGFDDNWTNTGMPEKYRYFCMGNALVVPLVETMGLKIKRIWEGFK